MIDPRVHQFQDLCATLEEDSEVALLYGSGLNKAVDAGLDWESITEGLALEGDAELDAAAKVFGDNPEPETLPSHSDEIRNNLEQSIQSDRDAVEELSHLGTRLLEEQETVLDQGLELPSGICWFLGLFDRSFTVNMDLLWLAFEQECEDVDAFPPVFLHGSIHWLMKQDPIHQGNWSQVWPDQFKEVDTPDRLEGKIEAIKQEVNQGWVPAAIFQRTPYRKREKIEIISDLREKERTPLANLERLSQTLVTFGWGVSPQDYHIQKAILQAESLENLWVGLHDPGLQELPKNHPTRRKWQRGQEVPGESEGPSVIRFFCTATAIGDDCSCHEVRIPPSGM